MCACEVRLVLDQGGNSDDDIKEPYATNWDFNMTQNLVWKRVSLFVN